jgi:2-oxoisovalerate ferredoxin oxidoreductase beta subunit
MSDSEYTTILEQPRSYYPEFARKPAPRNTTHYCPGCGHGILHKLIAEALDDLGIQDRTILVTPVGCSCFAYWYFDTGNVQSAHGRAPAVATALKRANSNSVVMAYQGDGDIAAIGTAEIIHAANRGENITVFFVNNVIYGMTGGQMAPTTLEGQSTSTSPLGRDHVNEGHPIRLSEMLSGLESTAYIERTSIHDWKHINRTRKAVRKALQCQLDGQGFSMVEVLSTCPTAWKMTPVDACDWLHENMIPVFPLGVKKDVTENRPAQPKVRRAVEPESLGTLLRLPEDDEGLVEAPTAHRPEWTDPRVKIAGFGGQGVLLMGLSIAQAGMLQGQHVTWLPSYGPEMRGGTAHVHVNVSDGVVGAPVVDRPSVLVAMNRPSLEKFGHELVPGGLLLLNSSVIEGEAGRDDVTVVRVPVNEIADRLGNLRVSNMVMFGAFAEATGVLSLEACRRALDTVVKHKKFIEMNVKAIEAGAEAARRA